MINGSSHEPFLQGTSSYLSCAFFHVHRKICWNVSKPIDNWFWMIQIMTGGVAVLTGTQRIPLLVHLFWYGRNGWEMSRTFANRASANKVERVKLYHLYVISSANNLLIIAPILLITPIFFSLLMTTNDHINPSKSCVFELLLSNIDTRPNNS